MFITGLFDPFPAFGPSLWRRQQRYSGYAASDIEADLAFYGNRLQRKRAPGPANEDIRSDAGARSGLGSNADVGPRQGAAWDA